MINKTYRLRLYSHKALLFLKSIYPYLKIKKNKCGLAINFQEKQKKGVRTMDIKEQLKFKEAIKNA